MHDQNVVFRYFNLGTDGKHSTTFTDGTGLTDGPHEIEWSH
jgi:hypothetical protein